MNRLEPNDVAGFLRRYRFAGSRLRRAAVSAGKDGVRLDVVLVARTAVKDLGTDPKPVRLHFRVTDVDELRVQKRPGSGVKVTDVAFGWFNGRMYANFDAYRLEPGERPGVHDFRASDLFAGGAAVLWEELPRKGGG